MRVTRHELRIVPLKLDEHGRAIWNGREHERDESKARTVVVELTVDEEGLAEELGRKAVGSKGKRSGQAGGKVVVRVVADLGEPE